MDAVTETIVRLVRGTEVTPEAPLWDQSRRAFLDYLGAAFAARKEKPVQQLASLLRSTPGPVFLLGSEGSSTAENAALFNGFLSHYLDFDDAQSNVMGHLSTVLFSALLAAAEPGDSWQDFFSAYNAGAELEGLLGSAVNPQHKWAGFHPTATLGSIGAAAAIARLRHLDAEETAQVLSLGATQAAGLGLEAGSDGKPLHAGFAARNGIWAWQLVRAGLTANPSPFNEKDGWTKSLCGIEVSPPHFEKHWLAPGQILTPGLWMKEHGYCSAGITGAAACRAFWQEGWDLARIRRVTFHFPPGAGYSLHYTHPKTGQEGRFSMEYVAWQILTLGDVEDAYFTRPRVPEAFEKALPKFERKEDLPAVPKTERIIRVSIETEAGEVLTREVLHPPGAPDRPFTDEELTKKLAIGTEPSFARELVDTSLHWQEEKLAAFLIIIQNQGDKQ